MSSVKQKLQKEKYIIFCEIRYELKAHESSHDIPMFF